MFQYFLAVSNAITATPKDEIDKNTYEFSEPENGVPTYGYDLAQAVKDGYLVDYVSVDMLALQVCKYSNNCQNFAYAGGQ